MKTLSYVVDWIKSPENKNIGHDFFALFPQPDKENLKNETQTLLYYAVEFIRATKPDLQDWRLDFLQDETLKTRPKRMVVADWNLWQVLKIAKQELANKSA